MHFRVTNECLVSMSAQQKKNRDSSKLFSMLPKLKNDPPPMIKTRSAPIPKTRQYVSRTKTLGMNDKKLIRIPIHKKPLLPIPSQNLPSLDKSQKISKLETEAWNIGLLNDLNLHEPKTLSLPESHGFDPLVYSRREFDAGSLDDEYVSVTLESEEDSIFGSVNPDEDWQMV